MNIYTIVRSMADLKRVQQGGKSEVVVHYWPEPADEIHPDSLIHVKPYVLVPGADYNGNADGVMRYLQSIQQIQGVFLHPGLSDGFALRNADFIGRLRKAFPDILIVVIATSFLWNDGGKAAALIRGIEEFKCDTGAIVNFNEYPVKVYSALLEDSKHNPVMITSSPGKDTPASLSEALRKFQFVVFWSPGILEGALASLDLLPVLPKALPVKTVYFDHTVAIRKSPSLAAEVLGQTVPGKMVEIMAVSSVSDGIIYGTLSDGTYVILEQGTTIYAHPYQKK